MNSKSSMVSVFGKPLMLVMMFFLAGCQQTLTTRTGETDELWRAVARQVCESAWRPVTYSSRDTEQTQLEARANNAARAKYCNG